MTLATASLYFDRTSVTDLAGTFLFHCQVDPFDDSKRDSGTAYRRIMSVEPGTLMPSNRTVRLMGRTWLVGGSEPDGMAELHREKFVIHPVDRPLNLSSLNEYLSGAYVQTLWASAHWVKDSKQLEVSSETPPVYDVTVAGGAAVAPHDVLWDGQGAFLVLSPHDVASGMLTLSSLALESQALKPVTVMSRVYDPVAGGYSSGATSSLQGLFVRWQSLFQYGSQTSERYQEGDVSIVLPSGSQISTSTALSSAGVNYQVLAVLDIAGTVVAHARRV